MSDPKKSEGVLLSVLYLTGTLVSWAGSLIILFHVASYLGLIADSFDSTSTVYMMLLVTVFALVKDIMFNNIDGQVPPLPRITRSKPRTASIFGLLFTLFSSVSLVILHCKGTLGQVVESISSTDFIMTGQIISSTGKAVLSELAAPEVLSSTYRSTVYSVYNIQGRVTSEGDVLVFCGNSKNLWGSTYKSNNSSLLYLRISSNGELTVDEGKLHLSQLGFPLKYFYYLFTIIVPRPAYSWKNNKNRLWSSKLNHKCHSQSGGSYCIDFKFERNCLQLFKPSSRQGSKLIPWKAFYSDPYVPVAHNCQPLDGK